MAIYRLLKFAAFDPEDVSCMTTAYEDALHVLKLAEWQDPITELVAQKDHRRKSARRARSGSTSRKGTQRTRNQSAFAAAARVPALGGWDTLRGGYARGNGYALIS